MDRIGIVAFAFGLPPRTITNKIIAYIASQNADRCRAPIYTETNIPVDVAKRISWHPGNFGEPVALLDLAMGAAEWAEKNSLDKLLVATAKPALGRAMRDLKHALNERGVSIKVEPCIEIDFYYRGVWFSPESVLARSRFPLVWWSREIILRFLPMFLYKRVASYSNPVSRHF